jgi:hypothetical protein
MEPEEIDKLFRDKLTGRPAVPSPDAWMRLQQKMEPPKKQRTMWVYYAAASVVVLLVAGILFFNRGGDAAGPAVATAPQVVPPAAKKPAEAPVESNLVADREPEPSMAPATAGPASAQRLAGTRKHKSLPSSRQANQAVGLSAETPVVAAASQPAPAKIPAPEAARPSAPAIQSQELAGTAPDLSIVEVVVKRDADTGPEEDLTLREQLNRKGHLLKNIYKQARNLKNGEPVELATIGVDKGRIQEETKELKQKLTNVISL